MIEKQNIDPEDSRSWDLKNPTKSGPVRNRRTVVSVSFPSRDFQVVSAAAAEAGLPTSQFIREAAIAKASPVYSESVISWAGGTAHFQLSVSPSCSTLGQYEIESVEYLAHEDDHIRIYTPA